MASFGLDNVLGYLRNLGSLRYGNEYCVARRLWGKTPFSPRTEDFFSHAVRLHGHWFVQWIKKRTNGGKARQSPFPPGNTLWMAVTIVQRSCTVRNDGAAFETTALVLLVEMSFFRLAGWQQGTSWHLRRSLKQLGEQPETARRRRRKGSFNPQRGVSVVSVLSPEISKGKKSSLK